MNSLILTGKSTEHIDPTTNVHKDLVAPLQAMGKAARQWGFDIQVASGFRSFERQLTIWNQKALGHRPLLDRQGQALGSEERAKLPSRELLATIMRWSAIPGASRHHWGSELDVYDQKRVHDPKLTPKEATGPLAPLHSWLDENMHRWNFFRPYREDLGGVSPEPWHLSYSPVSLPYLEQYSLELFEQTIDDPQLQLKELLLEQSQDIYHRYIREISPPTFS